MKFGLISLNQLQINKGFSDGLETALNDYKEDGFKQAWDGLQSQVQYDLLIIKQ